MYNERKMIDEKAKIIERQKKTTIPNIHKLETENV